ncbi:hypothetical protein ACWEO2_26530 [Nocardia sp. NPDC004278]|uniref:hypothetical protein n=1 Tax=Nocardia sp. NPDC005998 TaxID=3156894 RepID=UPI0033B26842
MRSAVIAAFVGATLLAGATGTATADIAVEPGTGSSSGSGTLTTGSAGGATTTGSSGTGSAGAAMKGFESLLFGGPLLCAALGSAVGGTLSCAGTAGPVIP